VEAMVVPRVLGPANFAVQRQNDLRRIDGSKVFHWLRTQKSLRMRKYLWRWILYLGP
jgi:hypothetical protein